MLPKNNKKGFSLVELLVVVLIIAVVASATLMGGYTLIAESRVRKVEEDVHNFDVAAQSTLTISHYTSAIKTNLLGAYVGSGLFTPMQQLINDINKELPLEYKFESTTESVNLSDINGISITPSEEESGSYIILQSRKKDPWGNPYYVIFDCEHRYADAGSEFYITVISAGPNGFTNIGGAIDSDDCFMLIEQRNDVITSKFYNCAELDSFVTDEGSLLLYAPKNNSSSQRASYTGQGKTITSKSSNSNANMIEKNSDNLMSLEIVTMPEKTTYAEGEKFDRTGLIIRANYYSGAAKTVDNYTVKNGSRLNPQQTSVTVSFTDGLETKTCEVPITVTSYGIRYALLYTDGTLEFKIGNTPSEGKTVVQSYSGFETVQYSDVTNVPWYANRKSIKKVIFTDLVAPVSTFGWFYQMSELTSVELLRNLDLSLCTSCRSMFSGCKKLRTIEDSDMLNMSMVKNMSYMFNECYLLDEISVSTWDTSNCTDMSYMFFACVSLKTIDVAKWDVQSVSNMSYMFGIDTNSKPGGYTQMNITSLDVSKWKTNSLQKMGCMFMGCRVLDTISVENFNVSKVTGFENTFASCASIKELDLSKWNTESGENMNYMFQYCSSLKTLELTDWNTEKVTSMLSMFDGCTSLNVLELSSFSTGKLKTTTNMFYNCNSLITIFASENFDVSNVTSHSNMFYGCNNLVGGNGTKYSDRLVSDKSFARIDSGNGEGYFTGGNIVFALLYSDGTLEFQIGYKPDLQNGKRKLVTQYANIEGNQDLTPAWGPKANTIKSVNFRCYVTPATVRCWFDGCTELTEIKNLYRLNTISTTDMTGMFRNCKKLKSLDLSGFDTRGVKIFNSMFAGCEKMTKLDVTGFITNNATNMYYMFSECKELKSLDVRNFNTEKVTNMAGMFRYCTSLTSLDVSSFNPKKTTTFSNMFANVENVSQLNLSSFDTSVARIYTSMFQNCKSLKAVDVSSFDTSRGTNFKYMFNGCAELETIYASEGFVVSDAAAETSEPSMFSGCAKLKGGNGTTYSSDNIDASYAKIDKQGQAGYFTFGMLQNEAMLFSEYSGLLRGASMTLDSTIGVNLYLGLPSEYENGYFATIDGPNGAIITYISKSIKSEEGYRLTYHIRPWEMADPITITLYDKQNNIVRDGSFKITLEEIIKKTPTTSPSYNLARATLGFGHYGSILWNEPGRRVPDLPENYSIDYSQEDIAFLEKWEGKELGIVPDAIKAGHSLNALEYLKYNIHIYGRAYMNANNINVSIYEDDYFVEKRERNSDAITFSIDGITYKDVYKTFTVVYKDGNDNVIAQEKYGILNYLHSWVLDDESTVKQKNCCKALYHYFKETYEYFEGKSVYDIEVDNTFPYGEPQGKLNVVNLTKLLPDAYQELEYIENEGRAYIDTLYYSKDNSTYVLSMEKDLTTGTYTTLFGIENKDPNRFSGLLHGVSGAGTRVVYVGNNNIGTMSYDPDNHNLITIDLNGNNTLNLVVNGEVKINNASYAGTAETGKTVVLFGNIYRENGAFSQVSHYQLSGFQIYEANTIKRDFVPCYRKSDGVVGLYDLVSKSFFVNKGIGEFKKGPIKTYDYKNEEITQIGTSGDYGIAYPFEVGKTYTVFSDIPFTWLKISNTRTGYNTIQTTNKELKSYTFTMTENANIPSGATQYLMLGYYDSSVSGKLFNPKEYQAAKVVVVENNAISAYNYLSSVNSDSTSAFSNVSVYVPYSSGNQISSIDVTRCGKNIFDKTTSNIQAIYTTSSTINNYVIDAVGPETNQGDWNSGVIKCSLPKFMKNPLQNNYAISATYTIKDIGWNTPNFQLNTGKSTPSVSNPDSREPQRLVTIAQSGASGAEECWIRMYGSSISADFNKFQIEYGSTATEYEAYKGNTYTVNLPANFYGGTVDLTKGEVVSMYSPSGVVLLTPIKTRISPVPINAYEGINNVFSSEGQVRVIR